MCSGPSIIAPDSQTDSRRPRLLRGGDCAQASVLCCSLSAPSLPPRVLATRAYLLIYLTTCWILTPELPGPCPDSGWWQFPQPAPTISLPQSGTTDRTLDAAGIFPGAWEQEFHGPALEYHQSRLRTAGTLDTNSLQISFHTNC